MDKKEKGAKKKKSKKPKAVPVYAFDLNSISLDDLKIYVTKLEKELALMRKDRDFYSMNKDKIMDFLQTMRGVYVDQKRTSVVQNSNIDDLIEQLRRFPEMYNEKAIISDREKTKKKLEKMFRDFLERNTAKAEHLDEEYALKQQILDVEKCLQRSRHNCEANLMDEKELFRMAQEEQDNKYSKLLESSLKQYVKESLKSYQDFNTDKLKMLLSVWNTKEQSFEMRESFINEIKEIQNFFYEISSNNSEVVRMLKGKLEYLLVQDKKLKLDLKETLLENIKLREVREPGFYDSSSMKAPAQDPNSMKNVEIEKKLQKLQFKNDVLKEELRIVTENWENMKKEFIKAIRMIYQKADFKAFVLEEIIKKKLLIESMESEDEESELILTQTKMEEKTNATEEDAINVFSMRVEDSDTLYVPPVYHEFWEPSFKDQFRGKKHR